MTSLMITTLESQVLDDAQIFKKLTNSSLLVNVTRHDTNFTFSRLRKEWEKSDGTFKPPLRTVQPRSKSRSHLH